MKYIAKPYTFFDPYTEVKIVGEVPAKAVYVECEGIRYGEIVRTLCRLDEFWKVEDDVDVDSLRR